MSYLLDTNILSELRKKKGDPQVEAGIAAQRSESLFVSVITLGELKFGIENLRLKDPYQAKGIDQWLARVRRRFADRILSVTEEIADRWGGLCPGQPLPVKDGLIAATALHHGLTVATRNLKDFERCGVATFNPFAWSGN